MSGVDIKDRINKDFDDPINGMNPDGGIFFTKNGNVLLLIECKHQGARGNAIERWGLNAITAKSIGALRYMTIFTGDGFNDVNKIPAKTLARYCILYLCHNKKCWNDDSDDAFAGNYYYDNENDLKNKIGTNIIHELDIATKRAVKLGIMTS